jgi:hypothetical protein
MLKTIGYFQLESSLLYRARRALGGCEMREVKGYVHERFRSAILSVSGGWVLGY